jgi:NADP-reducing hydrogenase subunit HndB
LAEDVQNKQLTNVVVTQTGCIGLCQYEPIVEVYEPGKEKVTYIKMTPEKAKEMVEQHLVRGHVLTKYTLSETKL